jgi:hypothetical protein
MTVATVKDCEFRLLLRNRTWFNASLALSKSFFDSLGFRVQGLGCMGPPHLVQRVPRLVKLLLQQVEPSNVHPRRHKFNVRHRPPLSLRWMIPRHRAQILELCIQGYFRRRTPLILPRRMVHAYRVSGSCDSRPSTASPRSITPLINQIKCVWLVGLVREGGGGEM